jgi:hypothetical protein
MAPCTVSILWPARGRGDAVSTGRSLRRPERAGLVRIAIAISWFANFDELRRLVNAAPVHAVQDQAVKVNVQVGGRAKALSQSDRTAVSLVGLQTSLTEQVPRDDAVNHLQHKRHQLGLCCQQQAQRDGQRQHPLAHRHMGDDVVDQEGRRLCHAPRAARRARPAPFPAEGHQLVVDAVAIAQVQEAVGQDAAFEERAELVLDELRQVGRGLSLSLREEGRRVLLHQAVQRGLFRTVATVVDRGAIRRPLRLLHRRLHARLPTW